MLFSFEDFTIDVSRRELRRGAAPVAVEPQVFDLLVYLIENRDRVVSRDDLIASVWGGRIVSESTLASRINAARQALGDSGEAQRLIKTIQRKGIRFVGELRDGGRVAAPTTANAVQDVTFCKTADGVHLAVATSGSGLPVVKCANWLNHIEYDWQSPIWSPFMRELSSRFRLIRYDERATGLSDWNAEDISFEAFVQDLEAVVDHLGIERFALMGMSQGAAVSIAYATRHPERVSRLLICGGYAQGFRKQGNPIQAGQREALESLVRHGWGQDNPAFRQVFTSLFIPGGTPEQMQWFNDLQRISTSPENAVRLLGSFGDIDVVDLLPKVTVPTLVLHARNDARVPFDQGLMLARGIPGARFVTIDSANHVVLSHEPAWERYVAEIAGFLAQDG
ncbi:alpha/beta fold hydrolase [Pseudorhodoplanes sp.]|uniref:alpha/beta fold hydrolase n=1 Tax=Pseudorhodoplanes sp. TaxID=1934341 RepID=UPI002C0C0F8B|nr:alpha/beta fold hydrolase [Pseudorhodoplanes sp.]HWV54648.1 alpha/beta fold hydrolase [Pseudorhodoplanes sp.]